LAFVTFVNKHLRPGKYSAVKVATDIFCNDLFINLLAAAKKNRCGAVGVVVNLGFEYDSRGKQYGTCRWILLEFVGHIRYASLHGTVAEIHDRFHDRFGVRPPGHHYTASV